MATVNFYLNKEDKQGKCFILMTYLANGEKFRHAIETKILKTQWIASKQRIKVKAIEDEYLNGHLNGLEEIITKAERECLLTYNTILFSFVKHRFNDVLNKTAIKKTLIESFQELGIILSDSLVTGKEYEPFRKVLLEKFDLRKIIQLPDNIFRKTEARTYILIVSKSVSSENACELYSSDLEGKLSDKLTVLKSELLQRMDYQFFKFKGNEKVGLKTLLDIGCQITRGRLTYKELRESNISFYHSVHLKNDGITVDLPESKHSNIYTVQKGDIIMCRVGKRCVGKMIFVNSGSVEISDCLYKISVSPIYQKVVWDSLTSEQGQNWIKTYAHGVCSQVISKSDLMHFPLYNSY